MKNTPQLDVVKPTEPQPHEPPLRTQAAAAYCGFSTGSFKWQLNQGRGPKSVKVGKLRLFRPQDLRQWLAEHVVSSDGKPQQKVA